MSKKMKIKIIKIVIILLAITIVSYGIDAIIMHFTGFNKINLNAKNYKVDETKNYSINGFSLNKLECNLSVGKATLNNINANEFDYENKCGDLEASGLHTKASKMNASLGKIEAKDFTGDLTTDNLSGDTEIQYATFNNTVDVHSNLGRVQLSLPKASNFYMDAESKLGSINCDFPVTITGSKSENKLIGTVGSNKNNIKLNVATGDIDVKYN
jgi:lia operon protein LiaG